MVRKLLKGFETIWVKLVDCKDNETKDKIDPVESEEPTSLCTATCIVAMLVPICTNTNNNNATLITIIIITNLARQ